MSVHPTAQVPTPSAPSRRPRPGRRDRRHRAAAVALAAGAFTMAVAETIHPRGGADGAAGLLQEFTEAPGTWTAWALLLMATSLLQLPGVLAWRARLAAGRGATFVGVATLLLGAGLVALFSFGESHGEAVAVAGDGPVPAELAEAYTRLEASAPLGVMTVLTLLGFHLGWALFAGALVRAGVLPWPVGLLGVVGALAPFFLSEVWSTGETIGFWLLAAVVVWVAVRLFAAANDVPDPATVPGS